MIGIERCFQRREGLLMVPKMFFNVLLFAPWPAVIPVIVLQYFHTKTVIIIYAGCYAYINNLM